jgi:hypothetical protein
MSSDQNGSRPRRGEKEEDLKPNGEERPGREESDKNKNHGKKYDLKESKESKHWLRMIARANPDRADECRPLWGEAQELTLIFSSILSPKKSR